MPAEEGRSDDGAGEHAETEDVMRVAEELLAQLAKEEEKEKKLREEAARKSTFWLWMTTAACSSC